MAASLLAQEEEKGICTMSCNGVVELTICSWNINGPGKAGPRQMVTTETFNNTPHSTTSTTCTKSLSTTAIHPPAHFGGKPEDTVKVEGKITTHIKVESETRTTGTVKFEDKTNTTKGIVKVESKDTAHGISVKSETPPTDTSKAERKLTLPPILGLSVIIFIQELLCKVLGSAAKKYLPCASNPDLYGVVANEETPGGSKLCNAVYFRKDKFDEDQDLLEKPYELMTYKERCYQYIDQGADDRIKKVIKGDQSFRDEIITKVNRSKLTHVRDDDAKMIADEVLEECKEKNVHGVKSDLLAQYKAPGEREMKDPRELLERRMAVVVLKVKSISPDYYVVVISLHNYYKNKEAQLNYLRLLFEFLAKIEHCFAERQQQHAAIIGGDFNESNWESDPMLANHLKTYQVPSYDLKPLRKEAKLKKIDFIVASEGLDVSVYAHDLCIPESLQSEYPAEGDYKEQRKITNHNPLSAVVHIPDQRVAEN